MRILPILIATLFFTNSLLAQVKWFEPADQWTFYGTYSFSGPGIERIKAVSDSTYNGKIYKKVAITAKLASGSTYTRSRLLRQEGQKIYALLRQSPVPTTKELLLYDFAQKVGDTLRIPLNEANPNAYGYIVKALSKVSIGFQSRTAQTVEWLRTGNSKVLTSLLVEGIGIVQTTHVIAGEDCLIDNYLFLDEPSMTAVDGPGRKFCSFESAVGTYEGPGNILCRTLPANSPIEDQFLVYPTFGTGEVFIQGNQADEPLQIRLFDLAGRLLLQQNLIGPGSIRSDYKGSAVLQISTAKGKLSRKVVFN